MDMGGGAVSVETMEHEVHDIEEVVRESHWGQRQYGDGLLASENIQLPPLKSIEFDRCDLKEVRDLWNSISVERHHVFNGRFGHIAYLCAVAVDVPLLEAMLSFYDPAYHCFTLGIYDLTPTLEEYEELLKIPKEGIKGIYNPGRKAGVKSALSKILGIHKPEFEKEMREKGAKGSECISSNFLIQHIRAHLSDDKVFAALALLIYGTVIFPKIKGYVDGQVIIFFEQYLNGADPVPSILAETFRMMKYCREQGRGQFRACAALLTIWIMGHLPALPQFGYPTIKFSRAYMRYSSPIAEFAATEWPKRSPGTERWKEFLSSLDEVVWQTPWMGAGSAIYRCGSYPWVPLLGLWGAIAYAPALALRQLMHKQFIPMTHGLANFAFDYESGKMEEIRKILEAWKQVQRVKRGIYRGNTSDGYKVWQASRKKGCTAPVVQSFTVPVHTFDEPVDYMAEAQARYELENAKVRQENKLLKAQLEEGLRALGQEQWEIERKEWAEKVAKAEEKAQLAERKVKELEMTKQNQRTGLREEEILKYRATVEAVKAKHDKEYRRLRDAYAALAVQKERSEQRARKTEKRVFEWEEANIKLEMETRDQKIQQLEMELARLLETNKAQRVAFEAEHGRLLEEEKSLRSEIQAWTHRHRKLMQKEVEFHQISEAYMEARKRHASLENEVELMYQHVSQARVRFGYYQNKAAERIVEIDALTNAYQSKRVTAYSLLETLWRIQEEFMYFAHNRRN